MFSIGRQVIVAIFNGNILYKYNDIISTYLLDLIISNNLLEIFYSFFFIRLIIYTFQVHLLLSHCWRIHSTKQLYSQAYRDQDLTPSTKHPEIFHARHIASFSSYLIFMFIKINIIKLDFHLTKYNVCCAAVCSAVCEFGLRYMRPVQGILFKVGNGVINWPYYVCLCNHSTNSITPR